MNPSLRKFLADPLFGDALRKDVTTSTGLSTPQAGLTHYDYTDGPHDYTAGGKGGDSKCVKCGCDEGNQIHKLQKGGPGSGPHKGDGVSTKEFPTGADGTKSVFEDKRGNTYTVSKRADGFYIDADSFDAHAKDEAELKSKLDRWGASHVGWDK